tara:strand:- start:529 stop:831 length:303 start_codon:yes stop_codon:yes gene_type:complete
MRDIKDLIINAVQDLNEQLPQEEQLPLSTKTVLFGRDGKLDSLGLVNLLVMIEQNIEDELEISITIADEKAMSQKHSPFKTIGTLADYLNIRLKDKLDYE